MALFGQFGIEMVNLALLETIFQSKCLEYFRLKLLLTQEIEIDALDLLEAVSWLELRTTGDFLFTQGY